MIGKFSIAFAVAVAVLIEVPCASAQATCQNPGQMVPCMQAFFANLGFAGQNNGFPYNNTVFVSTLHNYVMQNDIAGWNNLQKWMNTLITCAGGQSAFEACGDWHILMTQFNISQQEAVEYESQFRVLEYETGPAFPVITHNWFCMKQVDQTEGQVVQMCRQHFDDEQHQNPNMTCPHIVELLNCIERPFVTHCGRDVAAVQCNIEKIIYSIVAPDCNSHLALQCNGSFNPLKKGTKKLQKTQKLQKTRKLGKLH